MTTSPTTQESNVTPKVGLRTVMAHRFSLLEDKAEDAIIERRIRDSVELTGATPWILIFAIFVASVGLNVNSTAVIIGAMLISPLMGPIMGAGLGVAVYDFDLVRRALVNLGIATLISLIVSTLYFAISPLHQAQSELLSRTTPTIWDVLIALFGGLAGIIGLTRQEKSNVIPGVAIATALMPPVCTAGFGIATRQWDFVGGALYLYTINCVFIALATIIGIRVLRLKPHKFADEKTAIRIKLSLWTLALCTALPSAYLATTLVQDEVFNARARKFIEQEFAFKETHLAESNIDSKTKTIELSLIGVPLDKNVMANIEGRLAVAQLEGAKIIIHQSSENNIDVTALKSNLLSDLYHNSQEASQKKDTEILKLRNEIESRNKIPSIAEDISKELRAQYPSITQILVSEGMAFNSDMPAIKMQHLSIQSKSPVSKKDRNRITDWFKVRTKSNEVSVDFEPASKIRQKK